MNTTCTCNESWAGTYKGSHKAGCPDLAPSLRGITEAEHRMQQHVMMWGSAGYGAYLQKVKTGWTWGRNGGGVQGPPTVFKRKREAIASLEAFLGVIRDAEAGRL